MLLMVTTLFCSALCKLRRHHFPCRVCAVWPVADAAMAESLPWLCTSIPGEVCCSLSIFLLGLFPPGVRKMEQMQKRSGMDQAGVWTISSSCHRLAKAAWNRSPAPHSPQQGVSTDGERCRKPPGWAGGCAEPAKTKCWPWGHLSYRLSPEDRHLPEVPCLGLGASTSSPIVSGIRNWKSYFGQMGFGFAVLDLSSLLFPLFWGGCKKIFFFTYFSTGTNHWISYSLQPLHRKRTICLRLATSPALGLDFTCSWTCERAMTGIVKTVGRQSMFTELSWKTHS